MISAINRTMEQLASGSLVYRYQSWNSALDGQQGEEGTFSMCTFWLVEALTKAGRLHEARLIFEKMLGYSSHLRLFAKEVSHTGEQLGNFPQALTHMALISAASNLDHALNKTMERIPYALGAHEPLYSLAGVEKHPPVLSVARREGRRPIDARSVRGVRTRDNE